MTCLFECNATIVALTPGETKADSMIQECPPQPVNLVF